MPNTETIETELDEQPAAPASSTLEEQLAAMQEQVAALGRQVQRLNGDPDAPVTRADLYAALDELRTGPQTVPATASRRQLSDADVSAIADALEDRFLVEEEPAEQPKEKKGKKAKAGEEPEDEVGPPQRRAYFKD